MDVAKEKEPHRAPDSIEKALASVEQALENVREALGSVGSNDEDDDQVGDAEFGGNDLKAEADLIDVLVGAISSFEDELVLISSTFYEQLLHLKVFCVAFIYF